ncbi:hypothetical protein [Paenibacillus hamazuiensis]|uniref:hypothetical protein n=1 Tax=Paenibacillus hamazuiensis TaxID=2936508 RepID=UPI00200EDC5A|nr:hypothetical protein [Paenibacillus hamazuiensis]
MKKGLKLAIPAFCAVLALTACQRGANQNAAGNTGQAGNTQMSAQSADHTQGMHVHDAGVIPSVNSHKLRTTNEQGGTSYGLGSSVYSLIGSSGLNSDGFSSHLESRLSGAGIGGVKAFVFDDTVILAAERRQSSGSAYDPLQQKVLSPHGGQSGRGPEPGNNPGTMGSGGATDDNLAQAEQRIKDFVGGNVKVLKVTGTDAVQTIERMRKNAGSPSVSASAVADDLRKLLNMAAAEQGK